MDYLAETTDVDVDVANYYSSLLFSYYYLTTADVVVDVEETKNPKEGRAKKNLALFYCIGKIEYFDYAIRKKKDIINRP